MTVSDPESYVSQMLTSEHLAVLATDREGQPYTSLMAFAASEDLGSIYFATSAATRKAANLAKNSRAAMLIDSRRNDPRDFYDAAAVTAVGCVREVTDTQRALAVNRLTRKHPFMKDYLRAPSFRVYCLKVECFFLVDRFQQVVELHVQK
jgi:nitroimidazol reductase NimA-like FMN-containing flavoprotein (pyridoxamine 5'-phosphate oxidase superfamily)